MNISNIPYWIWAGPCFLCINSFTYGFVAYVSTHFFVYTYSLINNKKNTIVTLNILRRKIKPIISIILSQ